MADKLNEFAKQFNKGGGPGAPKGLGLGVKLLAAGAAAIYGLQNSLYTGQINPKNFIILFYAHVQFSFFNPYSRGWSSCDNFFSSRWYFG